MSHPKKHKSLREASLSSHCPTPMITPPPNKSENVTSTKEVTEGRVVGGVTPRSICELGKVLPSSKNDGTELRIIGSSVPGVLNWNQEGTDPKTL